MAQNASTGVINFKIFSLGGGGGATPLSCIPLNTRAFDARQARLPNDTPAHMIEKLKAVIGLFGRVIDRAWLIVYGVGITFTCQSYFLLHKILYCSFLFCLKLLATGHKRICATESMERTKILYTEQKKRRNISKLLIPVGFYDKKILIVFCSLLDYVGRKRQNSLRELDIIR